MAVMQCYLVDMVRMICCRSNGEGRWFKWLNVAWLMVFGVFQKLLMFWEFPTETSLEFTGNGLKKGKISSERQDFGWKWKISLNDLFHFQPLSSFEKEGVTPWSKISLLTVCVDGCIYFCKTLLCYCESKCISNELNLVEQDALECG